MLCPKCRPRGGAVVLDLRYIGRHRSPEDKSVSTMKCALRRGVALVLYLD